jgi:hypothetical protein
MKLSITRTDVWATSIEDRPGGLADKLLALAGAGANLEFLIARRSPEKSGTGVVFVTPIKGAKQVKAATAAGFQKTDSLHSIRVEGVDKPGICASITEALAEAGVNLRGLSAAALGRKFVTHIALDSPEQTAKAISILKKLS